MNTINLQRNFSEQKNCFRKFDLAAPWEQFPAFREQLPAAEEVPITEKK